VANTSDTKQTNFEEIIDAVAELLKTVLKQFADKNS